MTESRTRRQRAIAELIRSGAVPSQEALAAKLSQQGFAVTQATVSRDLEQLGAIKVRRSGAVAYALPEEVAPRDWAGQRLAEIVREWVRSIEPAGNLVVLKTPPGSAHLVGFALDQSDLPEVAGTICGDDTIFVALRTLKEASAFATSLRSQTA